jgi:hypothetical protein
VATRYLLERDPAAWLAYAGLRPDGPAAVVDSDVSTIAAQADKVVRVGAAVPWLAHVEFQSSSDRALGERLLHYNALLRYRHGLPVRSVAVPLRPEADSPALTGLVRGELPDGQAYLEFRYLLTRVWEQPVEAVLAGGLATLPLAPLAAGAEMALPDVVRRMDERLQRETTPADAAQLWTATYVLMGLRYDEAVTSELLRGVRNMRESVTYQAILREGEAIGEARGRADEARRILLRLGERKFGPPTVGTRAELRRISDLERLELLTDRVLNASSWDELLADR